MKQMNEIYSYLDGDISIRFLYDFFCTLKQLKLDLIGELFCNILYLSHKAITPIF